MIRALALVFLTLSWQTSGQAQLIPEDIDISAAAFSGTGTEGGGSARELSTRRQDLYSSSGPIDPKYHRSKQRIYRHFMVYAGAAYHAYTFLYAHVYPFDVEKSLMRQFTPQVFKATLDRIRLSKSGIGDEDTILFSVRPRIQRDGADLTYHRENQMLLASQHQLESLENLFSGDSTNKIILADYLGLIVHEISNFAGLPDPRPNYPFSTAISVGFNQLLSGHLNDSHSPEMVVDPYFDSLAKCQARDVEKKQLHLRINSLFRASAALLGLQRDIFSMMFLARHKPSMSDDLESADDWIHILSRRTYRATPPTALLKYNCNGDFYYDQDWDWREFAEIFYR